MKFFSFCALFFTIQLCSLICYGQETSSKKANVLDFEGEVFEGEKKRPDLFLDIKSSDIQIDNFIYMRPDFNDFFAIDKKLRTKFVK